MMEKTRRERFRRMGLWLIALIALVVTLAWFGGGYGALTGTGLKMPGFSETGNEYR